MHWFVNEQVEEEDWSTEMVERVQSATCAGGASDLDRRIERYLEQEAREAPGEKRLRSPGAEWVAGCVVDTVWGPRKRC
jgi:hypothetical protein